ncbi:Spy0128 family protein [Enterococcus sp. AZ072]|uniref:Spy0128 family protein n=1 Tax=unclassified Enterococcus TaxID=2608891 RepID=UPI003D28668C
MKELKKFWSLAAIISILVGMIPLQVFAETNNEVGIAIENIEFDNMEGQKITAENRIKEKDLIQVKIDWKLSKATLIETGAMAIVQLPSNLSYNNQTGTIPDVGDYQVSNNQLIFTFKQNYVLDERNQAPDFHSARLYQGTISLEAQTNSEDAEKETVDFGNGMVKTLYYDNQADSAKAALNRIDNEVVVHEPSLNTRGIDLFTNISITDFDGNSFTDTNPALKDANIKIHFDWVLADDEVINNGDYYTYQLPDYFSIHNTVTDTLKNDGGDILGSFTLDLDGTLTVTFNGKAENLNERQGTIDLKTELNLTTESEIVEIPTNIKDDSGNEITIVLPIVKADISKKGIIEADNSVTWTIILNEERRNLRNVVVRDTLPEGMSFLDSSCYVMNDEEEWESASSGFVSAWMESAGTYVYKFTSDIMNQPVKIVIRMKVEDKEKKDFVNNVTITGNNFLQNSSESSVSFNEKDNYKYCTDYDVNTGIFNWEIKATYKNKNGVFKDWMYTKNDNPNTAKHYLLKDTIKVYDKNGALVPAAKWSFSINDTDFEQKDGKYVHFTLKFEEAGVYRITYSTQSFEVPVPIKSELVNTATIIDGTNSENISGGETTNIDSSLGVDKDILNKDSSKNTFTWQVRVNKNRILMKDAVITDSYTNLAGNNQSALQLIESSLIVTANDGIMNTTLNKGVDYVLEKLEGDSDYSTGFRIKLIGSYAATDNQITLKYSTNYFVDKQPQTSTGALRRFTNSSVVTYTGEDGKSRTDGAERATWVETNYAYNGIKYGKYLAKETNISSAFSHDNPFTESSASESGVYWTALFNTWKTKIPKNTTITEALGEGQVLKELVIYDVTLATSKVDVASLGTKWVENTDYKYELVDGVPVITLLKDKTDTFAVFVSAEASDELPKYKNVATMKAENMDPLKVEGTVEKSAKDSWITKNGKQGAGDDYRLVNWSVVLNTDGRKIVNPVVTDTVSINEQSFIYDEAGNVMVDVYKAKDDGTGTFIKDGEAIEFSEENKPVVSLNSVEGTQTLTIDLGDSIETSYIIEYQTLLDPGIQNNEVISNNASLYGKDIQYHETTTEVIIKSTDGEGTSSGKNGSLKFRKLDENEELITSASAFFDLYRRDTVGNLTLLMQDIEVKGDKIIQNGTAVEQLSNLRYGNYTIIESKAPAGYIKDEAQHDFTISKNAIEHVFSLKNKKETLITAIDLKAEKILSGRKLIVDEFEFRLIGKDDNVEQRKKNTADGEITFDPISYDKAGVYTYTISEVIPTEKAMGITYDKNVYEVTVKVEEKDSKLTASVVYQGLAKGEIPTFENTYQTPKEEVILKAKKNLTGRELVADEFEFELTGREDGVNQRKKNTADGEIIFDPISYDKAGIYKYEISEIIPFNQAVGMTYDKTVYEATVIVAEKNGKLIAEATYEGVAAAEVPEFTNTYTRTQEPAKAKVDLAAKKIVKGRKLRADEFEFKLQGKADKVEQTQKNEANGEIHFDEISYDKAGVYTYTISEVVPSRKVTGMMYDTTVYDVTVLVEEKSGELKAVPTYKNISEGELPVFTNVYTPKEKAKLGEILLKKVDSQSGETLANAKFKVMDDSGKIVQKGIITGEDGTVLITGLSDGAYQLIETKAPEGYQLDETPIRFTVINSQADKQEVEKRNIRVGLPTTEGSASSKLDSHTVSSNRGRLPKTGSSNNTSLVVLGLFFLVIIAFVLIKRESI